MIVAISQSLDQLGISASQENDFSGAVSLLDLLMTGGFMMIPLILLWFMALYIFIERLLTIRKAAQTPKNFKDKIRALVLKNDKQGAMMVCAKTRTPVAKMIGRGVSKIGNQLKNIEVSIENIGKIEIYKLEKNLNLLATIAGAAPMIGFLGTVAGMIQAFMAVAEEEGAVSPKLLSGGIYEALVSTAAGLTIGILAYLGYNFLVTRVSKVIHTMEYNAIEFIELLQEPHKEAKK